MRALITGGAGFIGSHLAEALARRRASRVGARRPVDGLDSEHRAPEGAPVVPVHGRQRRQRAAAGRAHRRLRRRVPPGGRRRREADRRGAGPHDRDQRARHRSGAEARQQEEEARRDRVDLRGLRQEHGRALPRGRGPRARPDAEASLGVRVQQGDRRVPRAGVLEREEAAGHHHALLQHRRTAADRPLRHGDPELRPPGPLGPDHHRARRRHADAQLLPRRRRHRRARGAGRRAAGRRRSVQRRQQRGDLDHGAGRAGARAHRRPIVHRRDPVRSGLRVGLRGHAAPRAGSLEDPRARRLRAQAGSRHDPRPTSIDYFQRQ